MLPNDLMGPWRVLVFLLCAVSPAAAGRQWRALGQRPDEQTGAWAPHGMQLTQQASSCPNAGFAAFSLLAGFVVLGEPGRAELPSVLATCLGLGPCQFQAGAMTACSAQTQARTSPSAAEGRRCAAGARSVVACGGTAVSVALVEAALRGQCKEDQQASSALCLGTLIEQRLYAAILAGNCTEQCTAAAALPLVATAGTSGCTSVQMSFPVPR